MALQIQLTEILEESFDTFNLSQEDIVYILTDGTGSKVLYNASGARLHQKEVVESPADIAAMGSKLFLVTPTDGSGSVFINANRFIYALLEGTGAKVSYDISGAQPDIFIIDETLANLRTAAGNLVTVTPTISSDTIDLNSEKIQIVDDQGSGAVIMYDQGGARLAEYEVTESKGNINKQVYVNAGQTVYIIDAVDTGAESFTLDASHGDVTGIFANGKTFTVVDSTGNDAVYVIDSQSFGGGKTTVVVTGDITDSTADGDILIIV